MNVRQYNGVKVINDAYNAAPASITAALSVLHELSGSQRSIAVLGDMLELGAYAGEAHRQVGGTVAQQHIHHLIAIGELAKDYITGAVNAGMKDENTRHFSTGDASAEYLKNFIQPGDIILFKGSRGMNLDKVIETLFGE